MDPNNTEHCIDVITPAMPIGEIENRVRGRNDTLGRRTDLIEPLGAPNGRI